MDRISGSRSTDMLRTILRPDYYQNMQFARKHAKDAAWRELATRCGEVRPVTPTGTRSFHRRSKLTPSASGRVDAATSAPHPEMTGESARHSICDTGYL